MPFITEEQSDAAPALCIRTQQTPFVNALKTHLQKYGTALVEMEELPEHLTPYQYIFIFYDTQYGKTFFKNIRNVYKSIVVITYDKVVYIKLEQLARTEGYHNLRVINVDPEETSAAYIEKIVWFATTPSHEKGLNLEKLIKPKPTVEKKGFFLSMPTMTKRRIVALVVLLVFFVEFFFMVPLGISTYYLYQAAQSLEKQKFDMAQRQLRHGKPFLLATEKSYAVSRPLLAFFFITLFPENIIQVDKNGYEFFETALVTHQNVKSLFSLLLKPQKTTQEIIAAQAQITTLYKQFKILYKTSGTIKDTLTYDNDRIKNIQARFADVNNYLGTGILFIKHADSLLGKDGMKNYIVFFYNNMEMRPGGGFIGSFAHVTFEHYALKDFKVYDVYDADGQLTAHIEPPKAIRLHLGQPHWFLRDSNFSPDFEQNVKTAEYFLDKELQLEKFDGAVGITTTAISYILEAFGNVYIPDFGETINKDNFYLKAQTQSEQNFFAGSKQKKNYLSSIGRMLFLKLETASQTPLAKAVYKAFNEKHIVLFVREPAVQKDIDSLHWSGKTIYPQCAVETEHCIINHIMPVDANLGVNKANYFVSKFMHLVSHFQKDGSVENQLTITFTNNAASNEFPGGKYVNYFQLYLPNDAHIERLEFDGNTIDDYDETQSGFFKILGTLIEIQPKSSSYINITYSLKPKAITGENAYQVVIQKQIGAFNSDFTFEVYFPNNMFITDQNFKSLAKNNTVSYNSSLSTDKIFVIQFVKE